VSALDRRRFLGLSLALLARGGLPRRAGLHGSGGVSSQAGALHIDGYVPLYSTPWASIGNFLAVVRPSGGNYVIDLTTEQMIRAVPGITGGARLHPDGWVYYTQDNELRRREISSDTDELIRAFEEPIQIGGSEGDFDGAFRRLPISQQESPRVRIYDLQSDQLWEATADKAVDASLLALNGTQLVVHQPGAWQLYEIRGSSLARMGNLTPGAGHADVGRLSDGRDCLVVTSSNWTQMPWSGSEKWLVAVPLKADVSDRDLLEARVVRLPWQTGEHLACHENRVLLSTYGPTKLVYVADADATDLDYDPGPFDDPQFVPIETSAAVDLVARIPGDDSDYWSQPHAAWSHEGDRAFYGEIVDGTYRVAGITIPPA